MHRTDFLVIGSGLAGLSFAIECAEHGNVTVLTKGDVDDANTSWAQGGIAAAVGEADSWQLHEADTLLAGAGLCNPEAVRFLVQSAPDAIDFLKQLGAHFDTNGTALALGREGGHSRNRIVHRADRTGWEVERAMISGVKAKGTIQVFEHAFVTGLLMANGQCVGASAIVNGVGRRDFVARAVMLATGGCGKMYQHTTNPRVATADGIALAANVGALIAQMEFMQFHPTTLYHPQLRSFLITEAMRGSGATLRNHLGRRFMYDYDSRLELAPRDVVARAVDSEMHRHGTWCVYLDATHLDSGALRAQFPTIYDRLKGVGLEIDRDWIPVVPAQHYSCGGVVTDLRGRTSVPGLYAAGETTCTGVHGANRLASNSLLEAIVFARSAAADAIHREMPLDQPDPFTPPSSIPESDAIRIRRSLQRTMTEKVGIVRTNAGLCEAKEVVQTLIQEYDALPKVGYSDYSIECRNMLSAAQHVIAGALGRKENVGLHFNKDLAAMHA